MFGILTLFTALAMATVAAVFAVYGIVAIFAGMPQFALIMGSVIELGKIVGVSWLYRNWAEPTKIKYFMVPLVLLAILLTSMGIFGLLSKAHLEQTSPVANNQIQIERIDQQISREQARINDSEQVISQLDQSVQVLINFDRIRGPDGALAVRENQADQRELLRQTVESAQSQLDTLQDQKLELRQQLRVVELEVGPVKYLAELIYGDGVDRTAEAVRWVIVAFIFVFDPMAILLLMAGNYTLMNRKPKTIQQGDNDGDSKHTEHRPDSESAIPTTATSEQSAVSGKSDLPQAEPCIDDRDIVPVQPERTTGDQQTESDTSDKSDGVEPEAMLESEPEAMPESEPEATIVIPNSKKQEDVRVETEGVTPVHDIGGGYVEYNNHLFQQDALKELRPDLFSLKVDQHNNYKSGFGTQFPKMAKKKDIFVRVDLMPNRVYRFDGMRWINIDKNLSESYLYDQEYIRYLIDKIDSGEYDVELLSEQEKIQIEDYLNKQI